MHETEPKIQPEGLNEQEANNLASFSERLISGKSLEAVTDYEALREQMWQDARQAFLTEIVPNLKHFRRNPEREDAIRSAPTGSEERAKAEFELVKDYMLQLKEEDSGFGTTPVLSKELGYKLNCVGKSAVAASIFEEVGIQVECGSVNGHKVVVAKDSQGRLIYADPNGIVGKIKPQVEEWEGGQLYTLSDDQQADLGAPYSRIVATTPTIGFLYSIFNNVSEPVLTSHDEESKQIWEKHKDDVILQGAGDDSTIRDKLLPETVRIHEEVGKDEEFVKAKQTFMDEVVQKTFEKEVVPEEINRLTKQTMIEALACKDKEAALRFLEGESGQQLPSGFSPEPQKLMEQLQQKLTDLKGKNDRLRNYFLRRITKTLHPQTTSK